MFYPKDNTYSRSLWLSHATTYSARTNPASNTHLHGMLDRLIPNYIHYIRYTEAKSNLNLTEFKQIKCTNYILGAYCIVRAYDTSAFNYF
jgi:hypothetical protein